MALKTKSVTIPAQPERIETHNVGYICELCGKESRGLYQGGWGRGSFDVEIVKVEYESGEHYPEDRFTTTIRVDLCPDCFKNRLLPWLVSQGATPRTEGDDD